MVSTENVATQFCQQKGGEFGITQATLVDCIRGVNTHLVKEVDAHVQKIKQEAQAAKAAQAEAEEERMRTVTVSLDV